MSAAPLLLVEGVRKAFGGVTALNAVTLAVPAGQTRAIIGPNGAGKTTLFNVLTGFLRPDAGRVVFRGREITGTPAHRMPALGISRTFQITAVFRHLTVLENVQVALAARAGRIFDLASRLKGLQRPRALELLEVVGLAGERDRPAAHLALGDRKRLELALALAAEPELLLLDEPTAGMAPAERLAAISFVQRVCRERGLTLVFTEHDMDVVFAIADVITVLHQGQVLAEDDPPRIRQNAQVQQVYLGVS